ALCGLERCDEQRIGPHETLGPRKAARLRARDDRLGLGGEVVADFQAQRDQGRYAVLLDGADEPDLARRGVRKIESVGGVRRGSLPQAGGISDALAVLSDANVARDRS